jgi:hypothetical protein
MAIVFRPGSVQGPGSWFWPGHRVARVNVFLNQNDVILLKTKKQKSTGCDRVFDRVLPSHTGFFLPLFFLQPSPVPTPGRPAGPGFKTMVMAPLLGYYFGYGLPVCVCVCVFNHLFILYKIFLSHLISNTLLQVKAFLVRNLHKLTPPYI